MRILTRLTISVHSFRLLFSFDASIRVNRTFWVSYKLSLLSSHQTLMQTLECQLSSTLMQTLINSHANSCLSTLIVIWPKHIIVEGNSYANSRFSTFKPGFHISQFIGDLLSGIAEGENDFRNTKDFIHRWPPTIRPQVHRRWITIYENQALSTLVWSALTSARYCKTDFLSFNLHFPFRGIKQEASISVSYDLSYCFASLCRHRRQSQRKCPSRFDWVCARQ